MCFDRFITEPFDFPSDMVLYLPELSRRGIDIKKLLQLFHTIVFIKCHTDLLILYILPYNHIISAFKKADISYRPLCIKFLSISC